MMMMTEMVMELSHKRLKRSSATAQISHDALTVEIFSTAA